MSRVERRIRVRLSGFALFAGNIASFLLGFIFIVLVSRNLSRGDLGAWFFIGSLLSYFQVFEKILPYWVIRDSARGVKLAKTSAISSLLISIPFFIGFIMASFAVADIVEIDITLFMIAVFPGLRKLLINNVFPDQLLWKKPIDIRSD